MMAQSGWESSQTAVQARTAPGTFPTGRGARSTVSPVAWLVLLDYSPAVEGGVHPLLQEMRRADPALYQHSLQVWALKQQLATALGYPNEEQATITMAAAVHDVGKLTLPRYLLDKPTRLTAKEYTVMQQHPAAGARLLQQMGVDEGVTQLVYHHHERWDGQGYPEGLVGPAIPRGARLIAIADAFAAMTTSRPYQPARSEIFALQEMERAASAQFDPLAHAAVCHVPPGGKVMRLAHKERKDICHSLARPARGWLAWRMIACSNEPVPEIIGRLNAWSSATAPGSCT